jgi:hypothetical protein
MAIIDKPTDYFNTVLYTGNGGTQSITGLDFQPDFTWIKSRTTGGSGNNNHCVNDVVRAKGSYGYPMIHPNLTAAEYDPDSGNEVVTDFNSNGFSLGGNENSNYNSATYASWNFKAGTSFTNDASATGIGTIDSTGSVNTTSGFSIATYTGTGSGATVGHGLGTTPAWVLVKERGASGEAWNNFHQSLGAGITIMLNLTNAQQSSSTIWNNTAPTSSVFSVGADAGSNGSSKTYVAYCFAEKQGYSKFGSYTGNGNADGTFVYTGFSPAFVMVKRTNSANSWNIKDNRRNNASTSFNINPRNATLLPNDSAADQDANALDFLSNGFKNRSTGNDVNNASGSYIYMAFAENPFTSSTGTPVTAR